MAGAAGAAGGAVKIIAVAGTGSGCGKTTVACQVLRAIPGLGAVKISPREGPSRVEWGAGEPGKDTDLFITNGALRVARIIGPRESVARSWDLIKGQFEGCKGVVVEGASALGIPEERYVVFVVGDTQKKARGDRSRAIEVKSDVIVDRSSHFDHNLLLDSIRQFLARSLRK
jgi:hypothetical protein